MLRPNDLFRRAVECMRKEGIRGGIARMLSSSIACGAGPRISTAANPRLSPDCEVLNLEKGELVEVKSLPEILATLDGNRRLHGLSFLNCMEPFCSKKFLVYKRVETLYQEQTRQVRQIKNTVLLSDVQCDGLLMKCDRSCYLLWREAWLRRCPPTCNAENLGPDRSLASRT